MTKPVYAICKQQMSRSVYASNQLLCCLLPGLYGRVKRIWYLSPIRAAKVQASLGICAVSPEPSLLAHTCSESRGTFRQKAKSLAPLNGWACAVKICHDEMLEDTNSLDGARIIHIWAATWQNQQNECASSEDSDQPGHPPSLIRVFAVRMKKAWVLSYPLSAQRRLWSDWEDAQADLSLCWAHSHFVGFVMSRLIW